MAKLPHDFKEFLQLLNSHQVEYLLVGGYAVAVHGYPRYTGDIDVWVALSKTNASRIVAALREFGIDLPELSEELFTAPSRMTRMGREPMQIEILNSVSGLDFADAVKRAITVRFGDIEVPVISLSDLRVNKRASGRLKDLDDLENLPKETKD